MSILYVADAHIEVNPEVGRAHMTMKEDCHFKPGLPVGQLVQPKHEIVYTRWINGKEYQQHENVVTLNTKKFGIIDFPSVSVKPWDGEAGDTQQGETHDRTRRSTKTKAKAKAAQAQGTKGRRRGTKLQPGEP